jgi:hypothetical protein
MLDSVSHDQFTNLIETLWSIWFARCKAIHKDVFQSPLSTHLFVQRFISEIGQTKTSNVPRRLGLPGSVQVPTWRPPPPGFVKVKVDGAVSRSGTDGSYSAICRDENEVYLGASAMYVRGIADPSILEALACKEALALITHLNCTKAIIASDCQGIVDYINQGGGKFVLRLSKRLVCLLAILPLVPLYMKVEVRIVSHMASQNTL